MKENKKFDKKTNEVVPGPAIVVSRKQWDELQKSKNFQKGSSLLKKYQPFFNKIYKNSKKDNDLSI